MSLQGKVALVTGASRGIGRAVALRLASLGVKVGLNYVVQREAALQTAAAIQQQGGEALVLQADVSHLPQVGQMVRKVLETWGRIDILVNNAGRVQDHLLLRMPDEAWDTVVDVNLKGTFFCTREVLRSMVRQRWGRIINISSVVALRGNTGQANYSAAKAGVIGFTKSVAKEVASRNITVNAVTPGYITTDAVESLSRELKERLLSMIPARRFGSPEEVASLIAFLAGEEAGYITGQVISVDGGLAM